MKPEYSDIHYALAQWVRDGGALIFVGDDSDPYHNIRAWWNDEQRSLFDPVLRVHQEVCLTPGEQALLYDIAAGRPQQGEVSLISASSRIDDLSITKTGF